MITADEMQRRARIEALNRYEFDEVMHPSESVEEIRQVAIDRFTKEIDGKIANVQWQEGECLAVTWSIDIVRTNGKVRGGSGAQRNMPEYKEWRTAVFERDSYTCRECGATGNLNAHHIKSWASFPGLRFDIDNGLTLCGDCHQKEHPHINIIQHD